MALTSTDFNISFDLSSSPQPTFVLTDITDYGSQGVNTTNVTGKIQITAPSGVVYTGTNDVQVITSRINSTTILVPTLSTGTPEVGLYTFKYTSTDSDTSISVSKVKTFQYSYVKPTATNQVTVDCLSPDLKGSDTTNYLVNGITPSDRFGVSAISADNTFSLSGEKSAFVTVGDTFSIINSAGNDGSYTVTSVFYNQSSDTTVIGVSNVTDNSIGTLVTRKTTLFYPSVLQLSPSVGSEKSLNTNSFYSKTHEFLFTTKGYWDYGNGIKIVDSFSSSKEIDVDCDVRLCDIFCCINSTFKEYLKYKCTNKTLSDLALQRYIVATSHLASLRTAFECGDSAAVDTLTTQIKEVAQCNDDCSCSDDEPAPITGLGFSGAVVVASGGNGIEVASNVSAGTTTYTVKLNQSIINDIAAASSVTLIGSSDSSISVTDAPVGSNHTYDIKLPSSIISPKEFMAFNVSVTDINTTPVFSVSDVVIQNVFNFKNPTVAVKNTTPINHIQGFEVSDFQFNSNSIYKAFVDVTYVESQPSTMYGTPSSSRYDAVFSDNFITSVISKKDSGSFEFVLLKDGIPLTIADFKSSSSSKLNLNIKIVE